MGQACTKGRLDELQGIMKNPEKKLMNVADMGEAALESKAAELEKKAEEEA